MRNTFYLISALSILLVTGLGAMIFSEDGPQVRADKPDTETVATSTSMQTVELYYYRPQDDISDQGDLQCSASGLQPINRQMEAGDELITETLRQLLASELPQQYRRQGLISEFPVDVTLVGIAVSDGTAVVAIDDPQGQLTGGDCRSRVLRLQIEATVQQFPSVADVRFLPDTLFSS